MRRKTLAAAVTLACAVPGASVAYHQAGAPLDLALARTLDLARAKGGLPATGSAVPAPAPDRSASVTIPEGTEVPVDLVVNGERRGEVILRIGAAGRLLVESRELAERKLKHEGATEFRVGEVAFIDVRSIPGATGSFDERRLVLTVDLPAASFDRRVFDLKPSANPNAERTTDTSAFLNYRLESLQAGKADPTFGFTHELGVRWRGWLARNESTHLYSEGVLRSTRHSTQAIYDDRERTRRWIVGDAVATSGELGATFPIGGVALVKAYQLNPYFVPQPLAGYAGTVTSPSELEVFLGNTSVLRQRLDPGPFDLRNLSYHGGQRDFRVVVRDAFGREQAIEFPFYFTDRSLSAGLHDYGYFAGAIRENRGEGGGRYGRFGASGFHRYGFTDALTFGGRFEGSGARANAGAEAIARFDRLGVLALSASASRDRDRGTTGGAGSISYLFQRDPFNLRLAARRFDDDYVTADPFAATLLPRRDETIGAGYTNRVLGSIDVSASRLESRLGENRHSTGVSYSKAFFGNLNFIATWRRLRGGPTPGDEYFAGLFYNLASDKSASYFHTKTPTQSLDVLQFSRSVDPGEGLGYRLSVERDRAGTRVAPHLQYNTSFATFIAETREDSGEGAALRRVAMQGAITFVGGFSAFSRPVYDSFAQVQVNPALEGIRIYQNNREIGRTQANGRVLVPNLGSFHDNTLAIDHRDIPIEYAIATFSRVISPPFRSGSLVVFPVVRIRGVSARLLQRVGGELQPLTYHEGRVNVGSHERRFPIGGDGGFYLDEVPGGRYEGSVATAAGTCRFTLVVPESDDPVVDLKEPIACEPAP